MQPNINIGLVTGSELKFSLLGNFYQLGTQNIFSGNFTAEIRNGKVLLKGETGEFLFSSGITFEPDNFNIELFKVFGVKIGIDFHWESAKDLIFTGSLKLIIENGKLTAVNILPLEYYLDGVISSEMNPKSHKEFLKAHAVISRSWLMSQIARRNKISKAESSPDENGGDEIIKWYDRGDHKNFDVCADDHCQRYQGIGKNISETVREAIWQTRGLALVYNDNVFDARYSKCCGGKTELFENVWSDEEKSIIPSIFDYKFPPDNFEEDLSLEENMVKWIYGSPEAFCNIDETGFIDDILVEFDQKTKDFFRWSVEFSQVEISELIAKKSGIDFGDILDLIPVERGASGRLIKLKIIGRKTEKIIGKELEIRRVLSDTHLYSSAFIVEKIGGGNNDAPDKFILRGAGWGHGVGLCQIGAAIMARRKYRFDEILAHYYPGVQIKRVY
ncbi:MAG: SpoIID/LytB domain-containing protein [Chlorobi bacterium]|nr:SpoIID/LytB domain-containing protein [Chlorobiota bacterium]